MKSLKKFRDGLLLLAAALLLTGCGQQKNDHNGNVSAPSQAEEQPAYTDWTGDINGEAADFEWADPVVKHLVYTAYLNDETETAILENIPDSPMMWASEEVFWEYVQAVNEYVEKQDITIPREFLCGIKRFSFVNYGEYINSQFEDQYTTYVMQPVPFGVEITSLADFVHMPDLEDLFLDRIALTDISLLSSLGSLRELGLDCAHITDLSVLSELTGVTRLSLWDLNGQDLSKLKDMGSLRHLSMFDSTFADLNEVVRCFPSSLAELHLVSSGIQDITPLCSLTGLEVLHLDYNEISDLNPLSSLSGLKELSLSYNQIVDITPLASLTQLEELDIEDNLVTDIAALKELSELRRLTISWNDITDLSPLEHLKKLEILDKSGLPSMEG